MPRIRSRRAQSTGSHGRNRLTCQRGGMVLQLITLFVRQRLGFEPAMNLCQRLLHFGILILLIHAALLNSMLFTE